MQRRLGLAGFAPASAEVGVFGPATATLVARFQESRGLRASGMCDDHTWMAVVEAGWQLGDRMLRITSPHTRGDDVVDLQTNLARLGFDCGKVDGIFGPATARALTSFQKNCGLQSDGVCGRGTVMQLRRMGRQSGDGPGIVALRELESQSSNIRSVEGCRVLLGQYGGLSAVVRAAARDLRSAGALVVLVDEPDALVQATTANNFGADLYLGLELAAAAGVCLTYYAVPTFESTAGKALAHTLAATMDSRKVTMEGPAAVISGRRLPILRETKMPAVLCTIGPARTITDRSPAIAAALCDAVAAWLVQR